MKYHDITIEKLNDIIEFFTTSHTAEALGVSTTTIYNWRDKEYTPNLQNTKKINKLHIKMQKIKNEIRKEKNE